MPEPYAKTPIAEKNGIPVFSEGNVYIENYERIADEHLKAVEKTGHNPWMPEEFWKQLEVSTVNLIEKYAKDGDRILDVGVGTGRLLEHVPKLERFGMDISMDYLATASAKGINVCYSLVEDMPYTEEFFDVVVCTDVLEHVLDVNFAVINILKVLRPGGTLIVRVPYKEDLSGYLAPDFPFRFVHLRTFDEASLTLLFNRVFSCEVVETGTTGYLLDPNRLATPTEEARSILAVLPHLENLAPDLYWDILRKIERSVDLNVVVRKWRDEIEHLPGIDKSNLHAAQSGQRRAWLEEKLESSLQKNAFLTEKFRRSEVANRISTLTTQVRELSEECETLKYKLAEAEFERDHWFLGKARRLWRRLRARRS